MVEIGLRRGPRFIGQEEPQQVSLTSRHHPKSTFAFEGQFSLALWRRRRHARLLHEIGLHHIPDNRSGELPMLAML